MFRDLAARHHVALCPCSIKNLVHVPGTIQNDGIHPTAKGSAIIADTLFRCSSRCLRKTRKQGSKRKKPGLLPAPGLGCELLGLASRLALAALAGFAVAVPAPSGAHSSGSCSAKRCWSAERPSARSCRAPKRWRGTAPARLSSRPWPAPRASAQAGAHAAAVGAVHFGAGYGLAGALQRRYVICHGFASISKA
jgi:hypothetical protein